MRWVTDLFELIFALPWVGQLSRSQFVRSFGVLREFALVVVPLATPEQYRGAKRQKI